MNEITQATADIGDFATVGWTWLIDVAPRLLVAILILVVGAVVARAAGRGVARLVTATGRIDPTFVSVVSATTRYAILIVAIMATLGQLGVQTTSVLAILGAAGLAIGLALQGTLANIAAGMMLLWLRPFRIGETIETGVITGTVREIGLFATEFETSDGVFRFVPNSGLWSQQILNYSRNRTRRMDARITVTNEHDIGKLRALLLDLAQSEPRVMKQPPPEVFVDSVGENNVVLAFRAWIATPNFSETTRAIFEAVKARFEAAGINASFRRAGTG